jgi:mono/diheme cytochrome c family protein
MKTLRVVVVTILLMFLVLAVGAFAYLKDHKFEAREKPTRLESRLVRTVRSISMPERDRNLANPVPATADALSEGFHHYAEMCAVCHGNDGTSHTETAEGLYPPVPNLRSHGTQSMTDGEIYYVIENGIPFSGMPAWDEEEATYWKLVDVVRHFPSITPAEVQEIQKQSGATNEHK